MSRKHTSKDMVATKHKSKVLKCSTPEHRSDSPSRDSDSVCDSEAASPVPFLCTQDGAEGETDVVWNFYTPKSENNAVSRIKNTTPLSRKSKRSLRPKLIEKQLPKRRPVRPSQKKTALFQELIELNQNLHELIANKKQTPLNDKPTSEEDLFSDSSDCSPKCIPKSSSRCLRKNVLSSNFKPEPDTALESDDSMNECLLKASQIVEEKILNNPIPAKRTRFSTIQENHYKTDSNFKIDHDSMDAILNSIKLDSPAISKVKNCYSPRLNNDSFDSLVGNLNDSALEQLTQMPFKEENINNTIDSKIIESTLKDMGVHNDSPVSKSFFGRHNSMPESPLMGESNKPSSSGMAFGRYNSMPYDKERDKNKGPSDSPIRCTPDEIKKKHQLARERLMAKRLLPFTSTQQSTQSLPTQLTQPKKTLFQPKVPTSNLKNNSQPINKTVETTQNSNPIDIKSIIEKKRQEALMKLRRRQPQK